MGFERDSWGDLPESGGEPKRTGPLHVVKGFLEGNYFYVMSALLMMVGCSLLMRSPHTPGPAFPRTLQSLLILQGYEMLVIATAVLIVGRFRRLGDAFTLLAIELTLLLDPTFFSNAFITIPNVEPTKVPVFGVNACCLMLVLLKLEILQRVLRFRLTSRAYTGFLAAGVFVYLAEGPLNRSGGPLSREAYYYVLSWFPLALAGLFPALAGMLEPAKLPVGFVTARQAAWLPRFLYALPLLIATAHFLESASVYGIEVSGTCAAALVLAGALVAARHATRATAGKVIVAIDGLAGLALLLAFGSASGGGKAAALGLAHGTNPFHGSVIPILVTGGVATGLYAYYWRRLKYRPALVRIVILAAIGATYALAKAGAAAAALHYSGTAISQALEWIAAQWRTDLGVIWVGLVLFGIGIYVTFRKESLLRWVDRRLSPAAGPAFALGFTPRVALERPGSSPSRDPCETGLPDDSQLCGSPEPGETFTDSPPDVEVSLASGTATGPETAPKSEAAPGADIFRDISIALQALEVSAMETKTPPSTVPIIDELLKAVFMTDIETGIYLAEDLDPRNITDATGGIDWFPGESLVVCFNAQEEDSKPWPVVLTSRRMVYRPADRPFPLSLYYPQIAHVARHLGTLLFTGHAGQVLVCPGLSVAQAACLKRGLEKLLAEIAFDQPTREHD